MSYTKKQLWEIYIEKNPHWEKENITLTPSGLRKLVEQTYSHGYTHGKTISSKLNEKLNGASNTSNKKYDKMFDEIFKHGVK